MRHFPFSSDYLKDFEVVEERRGNTRLFPHTAQMAKLLHAINLEFFRPLPSRIARVDNRADGFHKLMLSHATIVFCSCINAARPDALLLHALTDYDGVCRVTIVQHITEDTPLGRIHGFRFYGGDDFFPEVFLSGKRLLFTQHLLDKFPKRISNNAGGEISNLLLTVYCSPFLALPLPPGVSMFVPYCGSTLAFPFEERDDEIVLKTCMSVSEISTMLPDIVPKPYNLHYGREFVEPTIRNWHPGQAAANLFEAWENKVPSPPAAPPAVPGEWQDIAYNLKSRCMAHGHGPGSRHRFMDGIPGPCCFDLYPGHEEPQIDWKAEVRRFCADGLPS